MGYARVSTQGQGLTARLDTCRKLASKARRPLQSSPAKPPVQRQKTAPGYYGTINRHQRVHESKYFNDLQGAKKIGSSEPRNDLRRLYRRPRPVLAEYVPGQAARRQSHRYGQPSPCAGRRSRLCFGRQRRSKHRSMMIVPLVHYGERR